MPLTTLLIVPSVQGTIPAYALAFASVFLVILSHNGGERSAQRIQYFTIIVMMAGIWFLLLCGSQLAHLISGRHDFGDMFLNSQEDTRVLFRPVIFTQTLYLSACLFIALFFRFFFREEWMRYVLWGAWFLAIYGIYEWLYYLVFKQTGDFIANRTYGVEERTGSWSQIIQLGPFSLLRIKSTYGEPSFFSAAVIPYLFLALDNKRNWLSAALLFCTVFSTSTSAYIAFPFAFLLYTFLRKKLTLSIVLVLLFFVAAFVALYCIFPETFEGMFTNKFGGQNDSGEVHRNTAEAMSETVSTFSILNRIFGIGFGYYYGSVVTTILVNTGWIGLAVYCFAFLKPAILLRPETGSLGLKVGVASLFFLYLINVSELFLPTTWMFLGLAYWRLDQQRLEKKSAKHGTLGPLVAAG